MKVDCLLLCTSMSKATQSMHNSSATLIVQAASTTSNDFHSTARSSLLALLMAGSANKSSSNTRMALNPHTHTATPLFKTLSLYLSHSPQTRVQIACTASPNTVPKGILAKGFRSAYIPPETDCYVRVPETDKQREMNVYRHRSLLSRNYAEGMRTKQGVAIQIHFCVFGARLFYSRAGFVYIYS